MIDQPFIIGVSGGTFSGKSSVCEKIVELLNEANSKRSSQKIAIIYQEDFYKKFSTEKTQSLEKKHFNFDHPAAFDTELMKATLIDLSLGKKVQIPKYNLKTRMRSKDSFKELQPCDVILFEGIFIFYFEEIRNLFNMKLFVDTDADTRLSRRVLFEVARKGKPLESVLQHYTTYIKPAFEEFCLPSKKYADIIIPRGTDNTIAINLIVQHIRDFLKGKLVKKSPSQSVSVTSDRKPFNPHSCLMNRPH